MASSYIVSGVSQNNFDLYNGDTLQAVSGGIANGVKVSAGGIAYVSAGGTATNVQVFQGGQLSLGPGGGQLSLTYISSGGKFYMNGGNASRTYLLSSGSMILNDGSALSATVTGSRSYLEVNGGILHSGIVGGAQNAESTWRPLIKINGGFVRDAEVRSGGTVWMTEGAASSAYISEGGLWSMGGGRMSSATLYLGGSVIIANAKVDSVYISGDMNISSGGTVTVVNGGSLTNVQANFGGTVKVNNGGYASSVALSQGGILEVNGGTAENIRATGGNQGIVNVKNGGTVSNILFSNGFYTHNEAVLNVSTGGSAHSGNIIEQVNVSYGGKVTDFNIFSSGVLTLYGGTATSTNVLINGSLIVSGGTALDTVVCPLVSGIITLEDYGTPAYMSVLADGSASNTVVSQGGNLIVSGRATDTTVSSGGYAGVNGGIACNLHVACDGGASVSAGGIVSGGSVTGGTFDVRESGTAGNVEVWGGNGGANKGLLLVNAGGFVSGTTAGAGGSMFIYEGAAGVDTVVSYGTVSVSGGWLSNTTVTSGKLYVSGGGTALKTTANENGRIYVLEGGILSSATVKAGGTASIAAGAAAGSLTVEAGGTASIASGGILGPLTVETGGTVNIASGAVISDPLTFNGGTITFDISAIGPNGVPLVADLSLVTGTPDYEISVANDQALGTYILAGGATGFDQTITVRNSGNGDSLGVLAVGEPQQFATGHFKLKIDNDELLLLVSNVSLDKPTVLQVTPSTTAMTNQSVTVSATFSANAVTKEFSFDQNSWNSYSAAVEVSSNKTVYFRCSNNEGTSEVVSYNVTNIDKTPPDAPVVTVNTQALTAGPVTITAKFSADSVTKQYSPDSVNWLTYNAPVTANANGTWFFRGLDAAGNASPLSVQVVSNIVTTTPIASADITAPTNQDVTVSATFGPDSVKKEYSLDNKTWKNYTGGIKFQENGKVYFRGIDSGGNPSPVTVYTVDNIDKVPPSMPVVSADKTNFTKEDVTVTASFSADCEKKEYSLDNKTWKDYTGGIKFQENGKVYFRGTDAAGNVSKIASYMVGNIDKTEYKISGDVLVSASQAVALNYSGQYTLKGSFGSDVNGSVTVLNGGKKAGSGTITNGVLDFNKGKEMLLDSTLETVIQFSFKKGTSTAYTAELVPLELFGKKDNTDDSQGASWKLGKVTGPGPLISNGWVGFGDALDYAEFTLASAANLSFDLSATGPVKFTLYGNTGKRVLTSSVKPGSSQPANPKLLEAGTYYLSVLSTNAKKGGSADYSVGVSNSSVFFTKGDTSDDSLKTAADLGTISASGNLETGWVGFGDVYDFRKITLTTAAKLNFTVSASDAVKFTLYNADGKSLRNFAVKAKSSTSSKDIFVTAGTYYFAVQSTNAKKGGNADYTVALNGSTVFFPQGDNSNDTWQAAAKKQAKLAGEVITGWVGFGDAVDFIKFHLEGEGKLQLNLNNATANDLASKRIKLTCLDANGKQVAVAFDKNAPSLVFSKKPVTGGDFYLGVTCANVKKFDSNYHITVGALAVVV